MSTTSSAIAACRKGTSVECGSRAGTVACAGIGGTASAVPSGAASTGVLSRKSLSTRLPATTGDAAAKSREPVGGCYHRDAS